MLSLNPMHREFANQGSAAPLVKSLPFRPLAFYPFEMAVQDDRREIEQIELFDLALPNDKNRAGTDATLVIGKITVEFELKSTTKNSVTTVRDFGLEHIQKWAGKHWLFGFYTSKGNALRFTRYASPAMMAPWIESKRKYIETDFRLADITPERLGLDDLFAVIGKKDVYSVADAQNLHKKQLRTSEYHQMMDRVDGFSPETMLLILRMRCNYVIRRGSTLNNPHILKEVLDSFPKITENHADSLRKLVAQAMKS